MRANATITRPGRDASATHVRAAGAGTDLDSGHAGYDSHTTAAAVDPSPPQASWTASTIGDTPAGADLPEPPISPTAPTRSPSAQEQTEDGSAATLDASPNRVPLADPFLALVADSVDDLEHLRKATTARILALSGYAKAEDVQRQETILAGLKELEKEAVRHLEFVMKHHPLVGFVTTHHGVGLKGVARLLAAIGDPYWNTLHDRPRTVSELWAYCGLKPGQKRQRGVKSNWSTIAKTRAFLIADSNVKSRGDYRQKYDDRRTHTAVTHPDWTIGHSHNDAVHVASKELLKDLWREAKRLHGEAAS